MHILVVEDNETNQTVVTSMLRKFGCTVELASDGGEAVAAFSETSYSLILMDCQMPVMDGYQATAEIRRLEDQKETINHTPIIALTANALEGDREKSSSPIDRTVLNTLKELQIEGEPDIIERIIGAYLRSSEPLVSKLRKAVIENDFEVVHNSAHSLKSSSANVGAMTLSEVCEELEMDCKDKKYANAADLISVVETEFVRVKDTLRQEIQST
jgi:CheY-like chemotaxis protein